MTITRSQVADLREGDVVELTDERMPDALLRGRVEEVEPDVLGFGIPTLTILRRGELIGNEHHTLTVVSRAPRLLYVNSDRTEPVPGDVVRDEDADGIRLILRTRGERFPDKWIDQDGIERTYDHIPGRRLRLLVDGTNGQVVPS